MKNRGELPLAGAFHGHGQPYLPLYRGPGFWPLLSEVCTHFFNSSNAGSIEKFPNSLRRELYSKCYLSYIIHYL
jgi:hypothetical protein